MGRDIDSMAEFTTAVGVQEGHEIAQRRGHDTVRFTGTNKTPSFEFSSGGEGRGTKPERSCVADREPERGH